MVEPAAPPPSKEVLFMKGAFREHYSAHPVVPPFRFTKREWGFFPFGGKMMFRHIAFQKRTDLDIFFRNNAPMHAYHSSAYYGDPGLQPMGEKFKTWMGADLVFDLDADHLPGASDRPYEEQLSLVRTEVLRLLKDFIMDDLGMNEEHIHLYFSGGRGYHVHVRDPSLLRLDSKDRRAIVDYITGRNIDFDVLFPEYVESMSRGRYPKMNRNYRNRDWGGWVKKTYSGKDRLIRDLKELPDTGSRIDRLLEISNEAGLDIGRNTCSLIVKDIFIKAEGNSAKRMIAEDKFELTSKPVWDSDFLKLSAAYSSVHLSGETDEPVTTDIKRLIRCPGSLHGKTGFIVKEVPLSEAERFDPMRDAVALPSRPIPVRIPSPLEIGMNGRSFSLQEGVRELPMYLAYFLIARKMASLP